MIKELIIKLKTETDGNDQNNKSWFLKFTSMRTSCTASSCLLNIKRKEEAEPQGKVEQKPD